MKQRFFFLFLLVTFLTGPFFNAIPAQASEHEQMEIKGVVVDTTGYTATFKWTTNYPGDSWVALDWLQDSEVTGSDPDASSAWYPFYHLINPESRVMIGRCDAGGNVTAHCVKLVTFYPNGVYRYRLKTCGPVSQTSNKCSTTQYKRFTSSKDVTKPAAPTNLRSTYSNLSVIGLDWDRATDDHPRFHVGYKLYRNGVPVKTYPANQYMPPDGITPSGGWWWSGFLNVNPNHAKPVLTGKFEHHDRDLPEGTAYSYYVTAIDFSGNESLPSNVVTVSTKEKEKPPAPNQIPTDRPETFSLSRSVTDCCRVDLSWSAVQDTVGTVLGVKGYQVYRNDALIKTTSGTVTSYTDTDIAPLTKYWYYVRVVDGDGNISDKSPSPTITTTAAPTPPNDDPSDDKQTKANDDSVDAATESAVQTSSEAPAGSPSIAATAFEDETTRIVWVDLATTETYYALYRRESGTQPWKLLTDALLSNSVSYTYTSGLDTVYEYRIDACNKIGCTAGKKTALGIFVKRTSSVTEKFEEKAEEKIPEVKTETKETSAVKPLHSVENVTTGPRFDTVAAKEVAKTINDDKKLAIPKTAAPCESNTLLKNQSSSSVYYCGADGKRHIFMNEKVFLSWYDNFDAVQTVTDDALSDIPLGSVITYRGGSRMVKIESDPKVYAIGPGGLLRWVTSEEIAISLYGKDWNKKVDDIPASLFTRFSMGRDISEK